MSSGALRELDLLLEPVHPSLVLDIESGKNDVTATVVQGDEPFEVVADFELAPSVAKSYATKASRLCINGDEAELDAFLLATDQMPLSIDPAKATDLPSCTLTDFIERVQPDIDYYGFADITYNGETQRVTP